jgi:hypothetical protein
MPPVGNISAQQALAALDASNALVGRNQGPELLASSSVDLTNGQTVTPNFLPIRRPIAELILQLKFRVAVATANYVAVGAEAPANILQRIMLSGSHAQFGSQTLWNTTGATALVYPSLFSQRGGGMLLINDVLASRPGQPVSSSFLGTTAGSPYDVELSWRLPMAPFTGIGQQSKKQMAPFWLQAADWGDSLQLSMNFADKTALGNSTGAAVTFSGYGGSGNPTANVYAVYGLLGGLRDAFNGRGGVCIRNETILNSFTALATATKLQTLQKRVTTNILVKSGILETTLQSAGVTTFASLSDRQLEAIQVIQDSKAIRPNVNNLIAKGWMANQFGVEQPGGYFLTSFVDTGNPMTALRGDQLDPGTQLDLYANVISASANNRQAVLTETVIGGPYL